MTIQDNGYPIADKGKLRKAIRKKVAEILKGTTDAGDKVFPNASVPAWEEELPAILIYPRSEPAGEYATAPRELERDLDLTIEIVAKGPEVNEEGDEPDEKSLEDILDDIAEQVECEMSRDETLGGTCDDSILTNTEFEFEGAGGLPIGSARLTYSVTYYTHSPRSVDKQIEINDLEGHDIEYNISEDSDTREAEDTLDVPES